MPATREELERKIAAQQDALEFAINAAQAARRIIDLYVPHEMRKLREFTQLYVIVESVAKQDGFTGPRIAAYAHRCGMLEAAEIAEQVAKRSGHEEWRAGAKAAAEEIAGKVM
jgi:hypothetical protein